MERDVHFWTLGLRGVRLKNGLMLVAMAALGIILLVMSSFVGERGGGVTGRARADVGSSPAGEDTLSRLERDLAAEAATILGQVRGAGRVVVSVRLRAGPGVSYMDNRTVSRRTTEEKDTAGGTRAIAEENESVQAVMARRPQGSEEAPVVARVERAPVDGVVVVAEGASDSVVRQRLFEAVQVMLGVPAYRVSVLPMKVGE